METELVTMDLEIGEAVFEQSITGIDSAPVFETQTYSLVVHNIFVPTEWVLSPWPGDDGLIVEWNQGDELDSIPTDGLSYQADLSAIESNWIDVDDDIPIDISWPIKDLALDSGDPESDQLPEPLSGELGTDSIVAVDGTTASLMVEDLEFATLTSGTIELQACCPYYLMVEDLAPFIEVQVSPWPGEDGAIVEWNQGDGIDSIPTDGLSYEADLSAIESSLIDVDDEIPIDISWPIEDLAFDSGDPESGQLPEPLICELWTDSIATENEITITSTMENPVFATVQLETFEPQIYYSYHSMVMVTNFVPFIECQVFPWPSEDGAIADQSLNSSEPESGPLSDPLIGESATDDLVRSDWPLPYMRSVTAFPKNLRSTDVEGAELPIGPDVVASPSAMAALSDPAPATATSVGISSQAPVPQPGVDQITGRLADAQPGAGEEVGRNLAAAPAPETTPAPIDDVTPRGRSFQSALESQAILGAPRRQESGEAVGTTSDWETAEGTNDTAPASTRSILLPMSVTGSSVRNPMEAGWGTEGLLAPLIADLVPDLFMI